MVLRHKVAVALACGGPLRQRASGARPDAQSVRPLHHACPGTSPRRRGPRRGRQEPLDRRRRHRGHGRQPRPAGAHGPHPGGQPRRGAGQGANRQQLQALDEGLRGLGPGRAAPSCSASPTWCRSKAACPWWSATRLSAPSGSAAPRRRRTASSPRPGPTRSSRSRTGGGVVTLVRVGRVIASRVGIHVLRNERVS